MINTIALTVIYLLLFYAFAAGIKSMTTDGECSDWLTTCPDAEIATMQSASNERRSNSADTTERL